MNLEIGYLSELQNMLGKIYSSFVLEEFPSAQNFRFSTFPSGMPILLNYQSEL